MRADSSRQLIELHKTPTGRTRTHTAVPLYAIEAAYIGRWRRVRAVDASTRTKKISSLDFQAKPRTQPARVPIGAKNDPGSPHHATQRHPQQKNERFGQPWSLMLNLTN